MSQRAKRPNRSDDGSVPVKRRKRTTAEEEEAASLATWQHRSNDLKSIYNRTTTEAPAELFRKDLISAMKLPDSEPLASHEYWVIVDQWKQEWERGVQVPVNPDSLPEPSVTVTHCTPLKLQHEFKLPKNKYIRITNDENFKIEEHALSNAPTQAEAACSYDLDECDVSWLKILNSERAMCGQSPVYEDQLERVIEQFELSCWDKIQSILRNEEGLGIEYDENVICDVCRSPDSEEGNEMVFCDSCNICVHQACYGITRIPEGQWLCCTCNLSKRPKCVLCPNKGGAMKCTRSGQKWAHVSCALWIPEVSIGCVEKMEPITKISSIPTSRWALICVLCRERVGACIQCSVKTCKTAYHVTCAFKHGLEMRAIIEDENADDGVKLRSYCEKHSKSSKKEKSVCSGSEDDDSKRKKRKDMTSEEKNQARAARLQEIEAEFFKHVSIKDVSIHLDVDNDALHYIYNYWKLKRKAGNNKPLLPPKSEDVDMLSHKREQADLEKMKMFVQLRQDLERVRNLCYMVSRREKLSRSFFRLREQTFYKQAAVLEAAPTLPNLVVQAVIEANHGPSIYDRLYSHEDAEDHTTDFDTILSRISGNKSPTDSGDEKKLELNGLLKDVKNPYKKVYFNGTSKRRSGSLYGTSSSSSSDERMKENRLHPSSSEDEEKPSVSSINKKKPVSSTTVNRKTNNNNNKTAIERRRKRHSASSRSKIASSSEEDSKQKTNKNKNWGHFSRSRLLQVERELGCSGSDSDELMPIIPTTQKADTKSMSYIYSDSDSSDVSMKQDDKSSAASDSQQNRLRTKAAVKEFSQKPSTSKSPNKSSPDNKKKIKSEMLKENLTKKEKKDYVPSDLIVPQRQAAKKASENLKSTTSNRIIKEPPEEQPKVEEKSKPQKPKPKTLKDGTKDTNKKEIHKQQSDIFDIDKEMEKLDNQEILAYVPQRQAAKKAAEHIKSGLGKPVAATANEVIDNNDKVKKDNELTKNKKEIEKPARVSEVKRKSSSNSSSSSSTSSSSDSSSCSSSDSDDDQQKPSSPKPTQQQPPRSESLFSSQSREATKRTNAKDWPFLDKGSKPTASSSSSDSSDSSRPSSPIQRTLPTTPPQSKNRKTPDKKPLFAQREEQTRLRGKGRPGRGRARPSKSGDRLGDANVRSRDLSDSQRSDVERERNKFRKGKSDEVAGSDKEASKSNKLLSPIRKTDKKLNENKQENDVSNLEREILERKAGKQGSSKTKSTLDRLFGPPDKKLDKEEKNSKAPHKVVKPSKPPSEKQLKSTVKENKEPIVPTEKVAPPVKRSPVKSKNIEDVFTMKSISNENKIEPLEKLTPKRDEVVASFTDALAETPKIVGDMYNEKNTSEIEPIENKTITFKPNQEYQNRSIFSPPHMKDNLLDFDNLEDGFGISKDEEIMKGPLTFSFGNTILFKEDSKEDSARETLNLVEKLRMGLSKKSTNCDVDDSVSVSSSIKNENDRTEFSEQVVPNSVAETTIPHKNEGKPEDVSVSVNLEMRLEVTENVPKTFEDHDPQDYRHLNCESDMSLEQNKNIPIQQHHGLPDHGISTQGDERWVPPSEVYPNIQPLDSSNCENERGAALHQPYIQQYSNQTHHKSTLPPQVDIRLHDDLVKNQSPSLHDRRISQTPLNDPASMDCMPSPSPYTDMHPQAKWAESEIMPNRRSSSSSAASTSSSCSRRNDEDELKMRQDVMMVSHPTLENIGYLPTQGLPFPTNSIETFSAFSDANQFVSPVSLFPPPSLNTPLAFPSTGPAMFPPAFGAPFPAPHSVMPALSKPVNDTLQYSSTCTATFTSSQHNMALTAAMVNLPQNISKDLVESSSPHEDEASAAPSLPESIPTETPPISSEVPPSPVVSNAAVTPTTVLSSPTPSIKSNSSTGKKSPSKPTRTSARVNLQLNKSPNKSPGKSPRQDVSKTTVGRGRGGDSRKNSVKTNNSRNNQNQMRGRGRGRGRGKSHSQHNDFEFGSANTIHNKLVGTVYDLDFDDDISSDNMTDLKSMRERRKSIDVHERKTDTTLTLKDSTPSPKFASPSHKTTRSYNTDLRELRPPTPVEDNRGKPTTEASSIENESKPIFTDIVQPVLPGPVDMRTYSTGFNQQTYNEANLLNAFASGTTESQAHEETDEDFEKELHTALTTTSKKPEEPSVPLEVGNIKVSLSDSRNQLKVKIKGPIANYSSTIAPLPQPTADPVTASNMNYVSNNIISNNSIGMSSGTSNLRRMRKKELLRQYWTQDMNMDDSSSCAPGGFNATPTIAPVNRTIITIPKAVASMTSIPTKDDYRDYRTGSDDITETKQYRKETKSRPGALTRELRQLDLSLDEDGLLERRRSVGNNSDTSLTNKRRGRPPRPTQQSAATPKIKIKIGNSSIVGGSAKIDDRKDRIRPPKKRLATINMPSVEDLKRESMKYRKMVMANFGEEKEKRKKKDKTEKRKRKKSKQEVQIISNECQNPTKLIIRIGKKVDGECENKNVASSENGSIGSGGTTTCETIKKGDDGAGGDNGEPKMTPIKLKLSRCSEGSGYVMKRSTPTQQPPSTETKAEEATQPGQPPPAADCGAVVTKAAVSSTLPINNLSDGVHAPSPAPLPLNKDCEVR